MSDQPDKRAVLIAFTTGFVVASVGVLAGETLLYDVIAVVAGVLITGVVAYLLDRRARARANH